MIRIIFFGDSHTVAVRSALSGYPLPDNVQVTVHQLTKIKNGALTGTISHADAVLVCKHLSKDDLVVSMVGGNQHSVIGLVQHPIPFDFADGKGDVHVTEGVTLIPRSAMEGFFETGLRRNDCSRILQLAAAGAHRTVHLSPPPPKADEAHILKRVETAFLASGIFEKGISPAPLRQKLWQLQCKMLDKVLGEAGVDVLPPPLDTMTDDGFLDPAFYARDATHANAAYGGAVLRQVLTMVGISSAVKDAV